MQFIHGTSRFLSYDIDSILTIYVLQQRKIQLPPKDSIGKQKSKSCKYPSVFKYFGKAIVLQRNNNIGNVFQTKTISAQQDNSNALYVAFVCLQRK